MGGKSKTVAILLAVFLSPAAWLYTYREDSAKFWLWAGIFVTSIIVGFVAPALGLITGLAGLAYWIWTIVGVAQRPGSWYEDYNKPATSAGRDLRRAA